MMAEIRSRVWKENEIGSNLTLPSHYECQILGHPKLKALPRIGDSITIQAEFWKVAEVEHDIDEDKIIIYVESEMAPTRMIFLDATVRERISTKKCRYINHQIPNTGLQPVPVGMKSF